MEIWAMVKGRKGKCRGELINRAWSLIPTYWIISPETFKKDTLGPEDGELSMLLSSLGTE